MSFLIAPSLLSSDFSKLGEEIRSVEKAGADWIHWDVMDGHFVPRITLGDGVVKSLRSHTTLPFDIHLMTKKPADLVDAFANAGADYLTFHLEASANPLKLIQKIKDLKVKAGISLKPSTPISKISSLLSEVDLVLVMTVEPGEAGQDFLKDQVQKVKDLRSMIKKKKSSALIEVDGGITPETAKKVRGADILVSGSYIFKSQNYTKSIEALKQAKEPSR